MSEAKQRNDDPQHAVVMCDCGNKPRIVFVKGSALGLRVVGCDKCYTTGPARHTNEDAWEQWNSGHRMNSGGQRICLCCT